MSAHQRLIVPQTPNFASAAVLVTSDAFGNSIAIASVLNGRRKSTPGVRNDAAGGTNLHRQRAGGRTTVRDDVEELFEVDHERISADAGKGLQCLCAEPAVLPTVPVTVVPVVISIVFVPVIVGATGPRTV